MNNCINYVASYKNRSYCMNIVHRNSSPVKGECMSWNYNSSQVKRVSVIWSEKYKSYINLSNLNNKYTIE